MAVALVCAMSFVEPARAGHQVELESTYLGEGWFHSSVNDPFFWFFDFRD